MSEASNKTVYRFEPDGSVSIDLVDLSGRTLSRQWLSPKETQAIRDAFVMKWRAIHGEDDGNSGI